MSHEELSLLFDVTVIHQRLVGDQPIRQPSSLGGGNLPRIGAVRLPWMQRISAEDEQHRSLSQSILFRLSQQVAHQLLVELGCHCGGHIGVVADGIVFHDVSADDRSLDAPKQPQHIARAEAAWLVM